MPNPVIVDVIRGGLVESRHTGAIAVVDAAGRLLFSAGDIAVPVYPRSAIKALQCVPLIDSGAADRFGFTAEEIALACSSHNGEATHVKVARSMLAKSASAEQHYECGVQWPMRIEEQRALASTGGQPDQVHNNCSGKHAGMLALARMLGAAPADYVKIDHPVQQAVAAAIAGYCDVDPAALAHGIDGCSVPTWAYPLRNMALGFARLTTTATGQRIIAAVRQHPLMVAGTGRFDTQLMQALPRVFAKVGAEGVYCGCVADAGIGIALKCDDGSTRAAEAAFAKVLSALDCWSAAEQASLAKFTVVTLRNWRQIPIGEVRAVSLFNDRI
jgi:L-asparaginase II